MDNSVKQQDTFIRKKIAVASIPGGPNTALTATITIAPNTIFTIISTVEPDYQNISLFDFLYTNRVDTNDDLHTFPNGNDLTSAIQLGLSIIDAHIDYYESSDTTNTRAFKITFKNTDTASHTIFFVLKAYTFASTTGAL